MRDEVQVFAVALATAFAACGGEPDGTVQIEQFTEIDLFHTDVEPLGEWRAEVGGFVGRAPYLKHGPRPALGLCIQWSATNDEAVESFDNASIEISGVGSWELVQYQGGELGLLDEELPSAPFLEEGMIVAAMFGQLRVEASSPRAPVLLSPSNATSLDLSSDIGVTWTPHGEDPVELALSVFSGSDRFLGAVTCMAYDNGIFSIPPIQLPAEPPAYANLHFSYVASGRASAGVKQLELVIRQKFLRRYNLVTANADR